MDLFGKTAHELGGMLRKREISSKELTKSVLGRINANESRINAYVTVIGEQALQMAEEADKALAAGGDGISPLTGIPLAIKDNMCTKGTLRPAIGSSSSW